MIWGHDEIISGLFLANDWANIKEEEYQERIGLPGVTKWVKGKLGKLEKEGGRLINDS